MKTITVTNGLQKKYSYALSQPKGRNFHFEFTPELTPQAMLELGVFGGLYSGVNEEEFPKTWFKNAQLSQDGNVHADLNYFKINASQSREIWNMKGWIHKDDPYGWFQWYARYFTGRRHEDDDRQIKRWRAMVRHIGQITLNCMKGDPTCRRRQRQALLHWAYDSRRF